MSERIIELQWQCRECGTHGIAGRHKACPTCGATREAGEMSMAIDPSAASVTDSALLDLAKAGSDWFCLYCGSGNRGDGERCERCGAERRRDVSGPTAVPPTSAPPPPRRLHRAVGAPSWVWVTEASKPLAAIGAFIAVLAGGWMLTRTHEVSGEVTEMRWEHRTIRETWTPDVRSGFRDEIREHASRAPVDGRGEVPGAAIRPSSCREKHHHDARVRCGTERVCEPKTRLERYECGERCQSNDNGFATCKPKMCSRRVPNGQTCRDEPKYCAEPVHELYCDYDTHEWVQAQEEIAAGEGVDVRWVGLPTGPRDRIRREARYEVVVHYDSGGAENEHVIQTTAEDEYRAWVIGQRVTLDVNRLGRVAQVRR